MGEWHVFQGEPDQRQSAAVDHPVSRFRPTYRALRDDEKALHDELKSKAVELEQLIEKVGGPLGVKSGDQARYRALALTALEESIMWAVKAVTA